MSNFSKLLQKIDDAVLSCNHVDAIALIDAEIVNFPDQSVELLAYGYDISRQMQDQSRYAQYQSRYLDFGIKADDKVLDMGSGHIPFPLATHLADIALKDNTIGRAGNAFKHVEGKPVLECSVEKTPFADKEFDFVYCSHVLEHVVSPEDACRELMRIGKRGYIECPRREKDTFFGSAKVSNHLWTVDVLNGRLIFTEYDACCRNGLETPMLSAMVSSPHNITEKAFAALDLVKAATLNVMFTWQDSFSYEVRRQTQPQDISIRKKPDMSLMAARHDDGSTQRKLWRKWNSLRNWLARKIEPSSLL